MTRYWFWWFTLTAVTFLGPEAWALMRRRPQDTLSAAIWRLEKLQPGQPVTGWTFAHFAFTGVFALLTLWLLGHFGAGWWR